MATLKVLVADDETVITDTLAIILNQHGYDAHAAYTGTGGVERARQLRPDFIISDILKPDIHGIEVMIRIREFLPSCKFLLFTGQSATVELLESARAQGQEFETVLILLKPVYPELILAWLRNSGEAAHPGYDAIAEFRKQGEMNEEDYKIYQGTMTAEFRKQIERKRIVARN
jgi:CheY-like chemotaxis protein